MLRSYKPQFDTPVQGGRISLVYIQATVGDSGAVTIDSQKSSPGTSITIGATGHYAITFPKCRFAHWLGAPVVQLTEATGVGASVHPETLVADGNGTGTGTGSFECTTETADTPAYPASGSRIFISLVVGN